MQPAEFRRLIEQHARLLHGVALAYCRNPSDRDDVLQEIAIQLWRARERHDGRTKVGRCASYPQGGATDTICP